MLTLCLPLLAWAQTPSSASGTSELPQRPKLLVGTRDPFAGFAMPVKTPAPKPAPVALPVVVAAAPVALPPRPSLNLVFAGRIQTGAETSILALHEKQLLVLSPQAALPNGFVVERMGTREVLLRHLQLGHTQSWSVPAPPSFETR